MLILSLENKVNYLGKINCIMGSSEIPLQSLAGFRGWTALLAVQGSGSLPLKNIRVQYFTGKFQQFRSIFVPPTVLSSIICMCLFHKSISGLKQRTMLIAKLSMDEHRSLSSRRC